MSTKLKVLVVDDNEEFRENTKDILELHGLEVSTAGNGLIALEQAKQHKPDVVLMDVRMPVMDGITALRQMRRTTAAIKVIMMSAYQLEEQAGNALREGVLATLNKPLNFDNLMRLLEQITSSRGGRRL